MSESVIINAVDRALDVVLYLYNQGREVSITEISKDLGVYKSTVFRTLATLQNKGFVAQNPENEKYSLGEKFYIIGTSMNNRGGLVKLVRPYAQRLSAEFDEAVNVSILDKDIDGLYKSVIIYKEESYKGLNANTEVGSRNECYCAAVGKCLLAFSENIDLTIYRKHKMEKYTDTTITSVADLKNELERIRTRGYAIDNEEREKGLLCIGAPILMNGTALAAISISGPESRIRHDMEYKIDFLKKLSEEISDEISRHPSQQ
jgi:Transcriptional regulator